MTQRISLKETYDNRDVIAWLVQQKAQIDDILTRIEGIETIPDNVGSDLRPIRRDNGQFVAVSKNLVQADNTAVGTDTKPVKIFNGEAVPVNYDLISSVGNQIINGRLTIGDRILTNANLDIETITGSTYVSGFEGQLRINDVMTSLGSLNMRRYANRTRMLFYLRNLGGDEARYIIEKFDNNRIYIVVENVVAGVTTNHVLLDSTP